MTSPVISAVVCTHNPRPDYLSRTLEALARQVLPRAMWEVIVMDNNSDPAVPETILAESGLEGIVAREPRPGKVNAMAAAAAHVKGDWVVFVDDDNVLAPNYFENLIRLAAEFPRIGVFSASISGDFETAVPAWAEPFLAYLAIRPLERAYWGNVPGNQIGPIGAGMAVRRELYEVFVCKHRSGLVDPSLGRTAGSLAAGTDDTVFMDLAFSLGWGCGAFPEFKLTHLIPTARLQPDYFLRIVRDISRCHAIIDQQRNPRSRIVKVARMAKESMWAAINMKGMQKRIAIAAVMGRMKAILKP